MTLALSRGAPAAALGFSSLADALHVAVERQPQGRFVHAKRSGALVRISYAETLSRAQALAAALKARGLRPGEGLVLNLHDSEDFIPALWGAILAGLVAVPLQRQANPQRDAPRWQASLAHVRTALGGAMVLTDDPAVAALLPQDAILLETLQGAGGIYLRAEAPRGGVRLAVLTSGATGRPKLVGLREEAVLARWWPKVPEGGDDAAFLSWSPFDHIMGLGLAAPNLGCKIHLAAERFAAQPLAWLDVMEEAGATHATMTNFGMSLIVTALEAHPERLWRLDRVRRIGVGAEQVAPALCARFLDLLAPFGLRPDALILGYGLTECGPVVGGTLPFVPDPAAGHGAVALDRPTAGHAVRIVDEAGAIVDEDVVGRVEVCGPTMTCGYLGDGADADSPFTDDGWLRTGDLGLLRDGVLTIVGRTKEQIVVNAKKYSCQEIEAAITSRSSLRNVYAVPLEAWPQGEAPAAGKPVAIVVADEAGQSLSDLAREVRAILSATYRFVPALVARVRPEEVPRTSLGKVQRSALAAHICAPERSGEVDRLAAGGAADGQPAVDLVMREVSQIWSQLLKCPARLDPDADFYTLGGDSILALQMALLLEEHFGVHVPLEHFADGLRLQACVAFLHDHAPEHGLRPHRPAGGAHGVDDPVLPLWVEEKMRALLAEWPGEAVSQGGFLRRMGPAREGIPVFWCLQNEVEAGHFGQSIGARRPAFAMRSGVGFLDYRSPTAKAFAARYADEIQAVRPDGPLVLGGNCQGTIIALDVARRLLADGREVRLLAITDTLFADLFDGHAYPAPVSLHVATRSKFNPYRRFRFPEAGLAKLFPAGHRMSQIPCSYASVLQPEGIEDLARDLDEAIAWAEHRPVLPGDHHAGGYPLSLYHGAISGPSDMLALSCGQQLHLELTVENRSPLIWPAFDQSGIALGNHWLSCEGEMLIWTDGRAPLRQAIPASSQGIVGLDITAPDRPGQYLLEIDLVEEGVRWFSEKNPWLLHIPVVVGEARSAAGAMGRLLGAFGFASGRRGGLS